MTLGVRCKIALHVARDAVESLFCVSADHNKTWDCSVLLKLFRLSNSSLHLISKKNSKKLKKLLLVDT